MTIANISALRDSIRSRIVLAVGAGLLSAPVAMADGALVVGTSGNFRDGIVYGWTLNYSAREEAVQKAVANCRNVRKSDPSFGAYCRVIAVFKKECFAVALTPQAPGAGWATAPEQELAERRAIAMCELIAGKNRAELCKVDKSGCDTD